MDPTKPFLLVRARPADRADDGEFERWFRGVHLRDAAKIPGIVAVEQGRSPGGAWLGILTFGDADGIQEALSSPEAAYARGAWQAWVSRLAELQVELFPPVLPLATYSSHN